MSEQIRTRLAEARALLLDEGLTLAVLCEGRVIRSRERGVKPLLALLHGEERVSGGVAADKVVGKAAAFLYVLLGVRALHACVISRPAAAVLERHGVTLCFDEMTEGIRNRAGTGRCPMESAVLFVEEPERALAAIRQAYAELVKK